MQQRNTGLLTKWRERLKKSLTASQWGGFIIASCLYVECVSVLIPWFVA
jgi:hypothetical protein